MRSHWSLIEGLARHPGHGDFPRPVFSLYSQFYYRPWFASHHESHLLVGFPGDRHPIDSRKFIPLLETSLLHRTIRQYMRYNEYRRIAHPLGPDVQ